MTPNAFDDSTPPGGPNVLRALGLGGTWVFKVSPATVEQIERLGYRVDSEELGHGAFSVVLRAQHIESGRRVAIKVITDLTSKAPSEQYEQEVRMLVASDLPHGIAPVCFSCSRVENAQPFLVLEWIDGERIVDFARNRELNLGQRIKLVEQLFRVYNSLHAARWIHGDPSPNNVLVGRNGKIRLIDFGNCNRIASDGSVAGDVGVCSGTPGFAPHEQILGVAPPSVESDVYGVASIAMTLFTGEPTPELQRHDQAVLLRKLINLGVPRWLSRTLVAATLAPDLPPGLSLPADEIRTMASVVEAFDKANSRAAIWPRGLTVAACSLSIMVIAWGALTRWQSNQESEQQKDRQATQAAQSQQLQETIEWLRACGHAEDDPFLNDLAEENQRWLSLDLASVGAGKIRKLQGGSMSLVRDAVRREQRECIERPLVQLIEACLANVSWVRTSSKMVEELSNARSRIRQWKLSSQSQGFGNHDELQRVSSEVQHLMMMNKQASLAKTSRHSFHGNLETTSLRLRKMPEFVEIDTLDRAADSAWQAGDFEKSERSYQEALHVMDLFLAKYETEEEKANRLSKMRQVDFRNVAQMRLQLAASKTENDRLIAQLKESQSRIERFVALESKLSESNTAQLRPQNQADADKYSIGCQQGGWGDHPMRVSLLEALIEERQICEEKLKGSEQSVRALVTILDEQLRGPLSPMKESLSQRLPEGEEAPSSRPSSSCHSGQQR